MGARIQARIKSRVLRRTTESQQTSLEEHVEGIDPCNTFSRAKQRVTTDHVLAGRFRESELIPSHVVFLGSTKCIRQFLDFMCITDWYGI